jgi:hypothetical protein
VIVGLSAATLVVLVGALGFAFLLAGGSVSALMRGREDLWHQDSATKAEAIPLLESDAEL